MDIGDASIGGSIGAVVTALGIWIRARAGSKDAETGMVPQLLERIDRQDARLDSLRDELAKTNARCEEERKTASEEHERQRQADREECEKHTEERVTRAVECVTREMSRNLHALLDIMHRSPAVTDSMSEEIEAVRRRSTTPPGEWRLDVLTPHPEEDGA